MIVDPSLRILRLRFTYLLIVMLLVLFQTMPIHTSIDQFSMPDIPLVITFVWVMRRPDVMGPILITIAFLFADMILQRPPGLWALIVLCGSMFLRSRTIYFKEVIFFYEWLTISIVIIICFIANQFLLLLTFLPTHNLEFLVKQALFTIMLYPIFIWLSRSMLRFLLYKKLQKHMPKAR